MLRMRFFAILDRMKRILAVCAVLAGGCPSPNTYTTPRTMSPGKVTVLLATEGWGAVTENGVGFVPTLPTFGVRVGVMERVELGGRLPNMLSAAADAKINLLRGGVDLAIDPGVQWYKWRDSTSSDAVLGSGTVVHLQLPVLLGFHPSTDVSIVVMVGPSLSTSSGASSALLFGQAGVGADLRITRRFSIFPQLTFLGGFKGSLFAAGLGFNFGGHPENDSSLAPGPH